MCDKCPKLHISVKIDVGFNSIEIINTGCFQNALNLREIKLNNNQIMHISTKAFSNLSSVQVLDLSYNNLKTLVSGMITKFNELIIINLTNNCLEDISSESIILFKFKLLITDNNKFCCNVPQGSTCIAEKSWYESCQSLLINNFIKIVMYCICLFVLISNVVCFLFLRKKHGSNSSVYAIVVTSNKLSDIMYGIFLKMFLIADRYNFYELHWRSSGMCHVAFALSLNYGILSPLLLCFSPICRFMVVTYPMETKFKKRNVILKYIYHQFLSCCYYEYYNMDSSI